MLQMKSFCYDHSSQSSISRKAFDARFNVWRTWSMQMLSR